MLDQLLAGHDLSPKSFPKIMTIERLHHLLLDQAVEGPDVGHHARHGINSSMDRDETIPLAALVATLHRCKRIPSGHTGGVEPGHGSHLSIKVFVFV